MPQRKNMLRSAWPLGLAIILLSLAACGFQPPPAASLSGGGFAGDRTPAVGQVAEHDGDAYDVARVIGVGRAAGTPDVATLSLAVSVTADTVAAARGAVTAGMQKVTDALAENDIAAKDIMTSHFRVHPEYDYGPDGREFRGYQVSSGLTVTVRDTGAVGVVIDDAINAGGNDIVFNSLRFAFSDTDAMARQAREAAVADMQDKAAQLAQFSGRELGDLKVISETPLGNTFGRGFGDFFGLDAAAASVPLVAVGEDEITVTVYGVYELR